MSAVNMYMNAGGYAQQTGGQQNWKQVKVKGNRAIIEFSRGSGYKLVYPSVNLPDCLRGSQFRQ